MNNCNSCGAFEHFTEAPTLQEKETGCSGFPGKDSSKQCLYTAQGMFMCIQDNKLDLYGKIGMVDNESMMMEAVRDCKKFKNAAPW